MSFLPDDYKQPNSEKRYMKFEDGANKFRALSTPVFGWEYWVEEDGKRKPIRVKGFEEIPVEKRTVKDKRLAPKYFWMFLVWNYQVESAQLLEVTQSTVQKALKALDDDTDWGDLREYDVTVTKSGKDKETEYGVNPKPKSAFDPKDKDIPSIDWDAIFTGDNPFSEVTVKDMEDFGKFMNSKPSIENTAVKA